MRLNDSASRALRRRRKALNPYHDSNNKSSKECAIEFGSSTIASIVLSLIFLGYFMMDSYLTTACEKGPSSVTSKTELEQTPQLRVKTTTAAPTPVPGASTTTPLPTFQESEQEDIPAPLLNTPSIPAVSKEGFPPACSEEDMATVYKQLPADGCRTRPAFEQACSFTQATTRGCRDPYWMREFYGTTSLSTPFRSFIVGYDPNNPFFSDVPLDALLIGSHKDLPLIRTSWFEKMGLLAEANCRRPVTVASDQPQEAKVIVITPKSSALALVKTQLGIPDDQMQVIQGNHRLEDKIILELSADAPIHYLRFLPAITLEDHNFLSTSEQISKAWYLEFTLDWKGT